jgi:UDP-glucose 4-epimerase
MKVAVTGGRGFIGSAVMAQLKDAGHDAIPVDRSDGLDILGLPALAVIRDADAVIHLAGVLGTHELFDTVDLAIEVNVKGTARVLDACRDGGTRYVGITMPPVFPSIYTATKTAADRMASAYHHSFGLQVSHVRAFNAFGPGQAHGPGHPQKIVPTFAWHAWRGLPIPIWGDGTQGVDLIDTDQLARVLVEALRHGDDVTFDAGTGQMFTVNQVADLVLEITGSKAGVSYLPMRRGEIPTEVVATGDGWDRLSFRPTFDAEAFRVAVEAYRP